MKLFLANSPLYLLLFVLLHNTGIAGPKEDLLKKISADPDNNQLRLQYADLLSYGVRASFIRTQIEEAELRKQGKVKEALVLRDKARRIFQLNHIELSEIPGTNGQSTDSSSDFSKYERGFIASHSINSVRAATDLNSILLPLNGLSPIEEIYIRDVNHAHRPLDRSFSKEVFIRIGTSPGFASVKIIDLDLHASKLGDSTEMLKLAPALERLSLSKAYDEKLNTSEFSKVAKVHSLKVRELSLDGLNSGSGKHLAQWQALKTVESLNIHRHYLSKTDLQDLSESKYLGNIDSFSISFAYENTTKAKVNALADLLSVMPSLTKLYLPQDIPVAAKLAKVISQMTANGVTVINGFRSCELLLSKGFLGFGRHFRNGPRVK